MAAEDEAHCGQILAHAVDYVQFVCHVGRIRPKLLDEYGACIVWTPCTCMVKRNPVNHGVLINTFGGEKGFDISKHAKPRFADLGESVAPNRDSVFGALVVNALQTNAISE